MRSGESGPDFQVILLLLSAVILDEDVLTVGAGQFAGVGLTTAPSVVYRISLKDTGSEALIRNVGAVTTAHNIVFHLLGRGVVTRVDGQASSGLSAFPGGPSPSVVKDPIIFDHNLHIFMRRFMDDKAIDTVVKSDVIFQGEGSLEVQISGDVNTRAIDDRVHVPETVIFNSGAEVVQALRQKERQVVAISVHNVSFESQVACSLGLSEHNTRGSGVGVPDITVNKVVPDNDIIAPVTADAGIRAVVYPIVLNCEVG